MFHSNSYEKDCLVTSTYAVAYAHTKNCIKVKKHYSFSAIIEKGCIWKKIMK